MSETVNKYKNSKENLSIEFGGIEPTDSDIATKMGETIERVIEIKNIVQKNKIISFDSISLDNKGEEILFGLTLEDRKFKNFFDNLEIKALKEDIYKALNKLNEREQEIIKLRFGIDNEECSLAAIGEKYNVTRERIRQIEAKALKKLEARNKYLIHYIYEPENPTNQSIVISKISEKPINEQTNNEYWVQVGKEFLEIKEYDIAIEKFETALKINKNDVDALKSLATAYYCLEKYNLSIEYFNKIIQISPQSLDASNIYKLCKSKISKIGTQD